MPPEISPEQMGEKHYSFPYNPIIANVLYNTAYIENWGTGAKRIKDICAQYGVNSPTWNQSAGFVTVTFKRKSEQVTEQATEQVQELINNIGLMCLTKLEITKSGNLSHTSPTKLFELYFTPAMKHGYITMLYPNSPHHPKQKYYLTEKGLQLYKKLKSL